MFRSLRPLVVLLALVIAGGAGAQTFQGLDSPQQPKKKKAAKKSSSSTKSAAPKSSAASTTAPSVTPASATVPAAAAPAATPAKATSAQDLGIDLSAAPAKAQQDVPVPPPPPKKGTAPTTTFEALDVTGRTADRQRLEAANASFNRCLLYTSDAADERSSV